MAMALAAPAGTAPSGAFTPCFGKFFLAAGSGEEGHKDGYFLDADFNQPAGLGLSKDQNTLYVADAGNHDLRAVALDAQNSVSTVAGCGRAGLADGIGAAARLSWPTQVATEADGSALWVLDQANLSLRRLDLKTMALQTVEPAPQGLSFTCMAADPAGGVYLVVGDQLLHRASALGPDTLVAKDPALACPDGRLVLLDRAVYFCSPCNGFFCALTGDKHFVKQGWHCLTPTASAFAPLEEEGRWKILFWSPDHASIFKFDPKDQATYAFVMQDYQGTVLPGPSEGMTGINASSDFRTLLKKKLNVAVGPGGILYYSEACSARIIGVDSQLLVPRDADANNVRQPEPGKPPHTIRLDVIGASITWFWQQYGAEKYFNQNLAFIRELERNLNLESALHGQGIRYEVQAHVNQLGVMHGSPLTYFLQIGDRIKGHQVDQVLICMDPASLGRELCLFYFNRTVDDLGMLPQQADWESMNGGERYKELGPVTRGLIDWVKANPKEAGEFASFDGVGRLTFKCSDVQLLKYPRMQQFAKDLMRKALLKDMALAKKYGATVAVAIIPNRNIVEVGEGGGDEFKEGLDGAYIDQPIWDLCKELGIPCYDADEPMRVVALGAYPLFIPADSHYMPRGHGWMASMLARVMTGTIP
ncbi:MAG TPA: hypothetical protein VK842_00940, partial [bacterium]|nr:hypothetical protein [bacterium]